MLPAGTSIEAGIYDATRDLYYFTGTIQDMSVGAAVPRILVFSLTQRQWLTPITLPNLGSALAIAESPDGTKMAVSDSSGAIYVFNPDNPAGAVRYPTAVSIQTQIPNGLAITNAGVVYYSFEFAGYTTTFYRSYVVLSPDGTRVYADGYAPMSMLDTTTGTISQLTSLHLQFWLDTASGIIHPGSVTYDPGSSVSNLCISGDGSTLSANLFFADASLNPETGSFYSFGDLAGQSLGRKLNKDGSFAFQQVSNGGTLSVIARNSGSVLYSVAVAAQAEPLSSSVSAIFDPLVIAQGTTTVGLIGQNGVLFTDLSSLPVPSEDAQPFPQLSPVAPNKAMRPRLRRSAENQSFRDRLP